MKVCPVCQSQWEDFVELCFKDGSPLVSLQKPVPAAAAKADLAAPPRPQLLPESQALPPVPEVTDEAERVTTAAPATEGGARISRPPELVSGPVAPLPPPPPSRVSDLDGPPAPPAAPPASDISDEETVMSVDALSRTSALPAVEEQTNTSEIDFHVPKNIGPVSAGQTILPMDDDEYRSFASPAPERAAPTIAPPVAEPPPKEPASTEKATPVNRAPQKTMRPAPPPAAPSGAPLGLAVMGLTAGAVVFIGLLIIWFWHNQQQGEGDIVAPPSTLPAPSTPTAVPPPPEVPPATAEVPPSGATAEVPPATAEVPPAPSNPAVPPVAPTTDAAKTGVIKFNGLPSGATITADGKPYSIGTPLGYGTHEVRVEASGYQPVKLLVTVNGPEASVSPKFVAVGRTVTVQLSCQGGKPCTALIDGQASVGLPSEQPLSEGLHSFRVGSCSVYRKVEATNPQAIELPCNP